MSEDEQCDQCSRPRWQHTSRQVELCARRKRHEKRTTLASVQRDGSGTQRKVMIDGVALLVAIEQFMRDESERPAVNQHTPHEALEVVSGQLLHAIERAAGKGVAISALGIARAELEKQTEYADELEKGGPAALDAQEALGRLEQAQGLDMAGLSAAGATVKVNEAGQSVVVFPNGETVVLDAKQ